MAPPLRAATGFVSDRITVTERGSTAARAQHVVLIPGLASGPAIWTQLTNALPSYHYHLVQVRGFAGSKPGANGSGAMLEPIADEISRYIKARGLRSPAIVGHSMGGTLAMMVALRKDGAAGRIMVVDMLPEGSAMLGGTAAGFGYLASQLNGYFTGTKAGRQILADMVRQTKGASDSDPAVVSQALTELAQIDLGPRLSSLKQPLKVVFAVTRDAQARQQQIDRYRRAYAAAPQVIVKPIGPSGHMVMLDQPALFAEAVKGFVGE